MMTACMPLSRKYSPMVQPVNGAMYCIGAGSDAVAATTIEYSSAPCSSSTLTNWATADRDQRIDRLEAGRHRLVHRLARNDAGSLDVDAHALVGLDRALAVNGI